MKKNIIDIFIRTNEISELINLIEISKEFKNYENILLYELLFYQKDLGLNLLMDEVMIINESRKIIKYKIPINKLISFKSIPYNESYIIYHS